MIRRLRRFVARRCRKKADGLIAPAAVSLRYYEPGTIGHEKCQLALEMGRVWLALAQAFTPEGE